MDGNEFGITCFLCFREFALHQQQDLLMLCGFATLLA